MSWTYLDLIMAIKNGDSKTALNIIDEGYEAREMKKGKNTALIWACQLMLDDVALKLIEKGVEDVGHIGQHENTALHWACDNKMEKVAFKLIDTGKAKPGQVNEFKLTALLYCVQAEKNEMEKVALKLIETGKANLAQGDKDGKTALIWACKNNLEKLALALLATGQAKPEQVTKKVKSTALMYACDNKMEKVALALIKTHKAKPENVRKDGWTALITACNKNLRDVALALLKTGKARPEQVTYKSGDTALNNTLYKDDIRKMEPVALKLIASGKARQDHVNKLGSTALIKSIIGKNNKITTALLKTRKAVPETISNIHKNTALIHACKNKMTDIALKILENCKAKPAHIQKDGYTALYWVNKNHLPKKLKERLEEMLVKCHTRKAKVTRKAKASQKTKKTQKNKTKKRL